MKKIVMIEESLYEFSKSNKNPKKKHYKKLIDDEYVHEDELDPQEIEDIIDVDTSDMTDTEEIKFEEKGEKISNNELAKALENETKIPEFTRRSISFRVKGEKSVTSAVPMAKMKNDCFLFKLENGTLKKFNIKNIVVESNKRKENIKAKHINEKFKEGSDPIKDMGIGPQGIAYRCGSCGSLTDDNGDILHPGESFELAKSIIDYYGDDKEHVKYVWCNGCANKESNRQSEDEFRKEQYRDWVRQEEEEHYRQYGY